MDSLSQVAILPTSYRILYTFPLRSVSRKDCLLPVELQTRIIENKKADFRKDPCLSISPTTPHCGYFATVTVTVSNPHTKAVIASVVCMS